MRTKSPDIESLTKEALRLRRRFRAAAHRQGRRAWTREQVMQGFVVDVGDLMRLVMARSGSRDAADVDARLAHELADCLWSVLVLAKLYRVDLEREFRRMVDTVARDLARGPARRTARR